MRITRLLGVLVLVAMIAAAQPAGLQVDPASQEGLLLQQIGRTDGTQAKVSLLEEFASKYPDHPAAAWALAQLPPAYAELDQPEKSLAACGKMLQKSPDNASGAHACLKTAEARKDPDLVLTWALATRAAAMKAATAPKPESEADVETWQQNVDFATQVGSYAEWSIYNQFLATPDPVKKTELAEALKEANPESQYVPMLASQLFLALVQSGKGDEGLAMVEEAVASKTVNEDMLLVAADLYSRNQDTAKSLEYATMLIDYIEPKSAPQGVSPEDWEKKKNASLAKGYYIIGSTYSAQHKYADADQTLRKALPLIGEDPQLLPAALFHLGVANFQLGSKSGAEKDILAAFNYTKQCAEMESPFQAQAKKNLAAIQAQYRIK